jgi:hypothetical protein
MTENTRSDPNVTTRGKSEIDWQQELYGYHDMTKTQNNLRVAGFIFASAVGLTLGLTAPFVVSRSPLPYMATPKEKVYRALEFLAQKNKHKTSQGDRVFVDLGSGDGEAVLQAARLGYKATGLELNFTLYAFSCLRRRLFWSPEERANSQFVRGNMFQYNVSGAPTVMIFGVTPLMASLSQKLRTECQPGTCVLSYRFAIPLAFEGQHDLLQAKIVYDEQEMRIYETLPTANDEEEANSDTNVGSG